MKKQLFFPAFLSQKLACAALLLFFLFGKMMAQPIYKEFKSSDGEVLIRYEDGYTISKADFEESERLRLSSSDADAAIRLNKKNYKAWNYRALAKMNKGDDDGAISDYTECIRLNPKDEYSWNARGASKMNKGDDDGAISDYTECIRLNPKFESAWNNRGASKKHKGDYDGAISDYTECIRLNPKLDGAWYNRGIAKKNKGDYDGAISDYTECIRLYPEFESAWLHRGVLKMNKGDYNGAISDYTECIRLNPKFEDAWNARGASKLNKGDYDGAISDYTECIRLNPKFESAWYGRGNSKLSKGHYDGAISDYNEAIRLNPNFAIAYNSRGYSKELKGNLTGAIADYKKAIEFDPNFEIAKNNLRRAEAELVAQQPKRAPKVHLLPVAVGQYQHDYQLSNIEFTVPGAYLMKNVFEKRGLANRVPVLTNSKATRSAILAALEKLTDPAEVLPDDLVLFYFSGHGMLTGKRLGICPYNFQGANDLITDREIEEIMARCPANHKICLIEACKNEVALDVLDPTEVENFHKSRRAISSGLVYLTSSEVGKKSWGDAEGGHFTKAVIEALDEGRADSDGDRIITAGELFDYVKTKTGQLTNSKQVPQINTGYPSGLEVMKLPRN